MTAISPNPAGLRITVNGKKTKPEVKVQKKKIKAKKTKKPIGEMITAGNIDWKKIEAEVRDLVPILLEHIELEKFPEKFEEKEMEMPNVEELIHEIVHDLEVGKGNSKRKPQK